MPSKSTKQARFMAACAHGAEYSSCPPSKVSTEFNQADKGSKLLSRAMHVAKKYGGKTLASKASVNYRPGHGDKRCANCTMYRNPNSCTSVAGHILPSDLCDLFNAKKRQEGGRIGSTYKIQKGDTLSGLSKKLGVPIADLMKLNPNIKNPDVIRAGDMLSWKKPEPLAAGPVKAKYVGRGKEPLPYVGGPDIQLPAVTNRPLDTGAGAQPGLAPSIGAAAASPAQPSTNFNPTTLTPGKASALQSNPQWQAGVEVKPPPVPPSAIDIEVVPAPPPPPVTKVGPSALTTLHNYLDPVRVLANHAGDPNFRPGIANYLQTALLGIGSGTPLPEMPLPPTRLPQTELSGPVNRLMQFPGWWRPGGKWGMLVGGPEPSPYGITPESPVGPSAEGITPMAISPFARQDGGATNQEIGDYLQSLIDKVPRFRTPYGKPLNKTTAGTYSTFAGPIGFLGRDDGGQTSFPIPTAEEAEYLKAILGKAPNWNPQGRPLSTTKHAPGGGIPVGSVPKKIGSGPTGPELGAAIRTSRMASGAGFLHSRVPGRTDNLSLNVRNGSYVLPADTVSHFGQGNSLAGAAALDKLFRQGPYGVPPGRTISVRAAPMPKMGTLRFSNKPIATAPKASGGQTHVPVMAAGGEYLVQPEVVARIGGGNPERGFRILDQLVLNSRKKNIKQLKQLKPPRKD